MKVNRSISARLSGYMLINTMLLFLVCLVGVFIVSYRAITKTAYDNASNVLNTVIAELECVFADTEAATKNMSLRVKEHIDDPDYMFEITKSFVSSNDNIVGSMTAFEANFYPQKGEYFDPYSFINPKTGEIESSSPGGNEYDYFTMDWYQIPVLLEDCYWCEPYFDEGGGNMMMTTYSVPVWDDAHEHVNAVVTADITLETLTEIISRLQPYNNSYSVLISRSGSYVSHPDASKVLKETFFTDAKALGNKDLYNLGIPIVNHSFGLAKVKMDRAGKDFAVYGALSNGWSVCMFCPSSDIIGDITRMSFLILLISAVGMLVLFFLIRRIVSRTTQPITEFAYTAMNIAKGNFHATVPDVHTEDEIMRLHDSLTYMLTSVNAYIRELKTSTAANEKFESELNIASNIQMQMLPTDFPVCDRYDLHALLHPAREVGGDLYDFFEKDGWLYFAVGDVSGKGVPAALYMAITRSSFRFISGLGLSASETMTQINNAVSNGNTTNMFVTLFTGRINLSTLEMEYCNAGHNPIVVINPDGKAAFLHAKPNLAAGLFGGFVYASEKITLEKGTRLLIYTDGVSEAENVAKELYGEDRLIAFANLESVSDSSTEYIGNLLKDVKKFTDGNEQNDDITIMSIRL